MAVGSCGPPMTLTPSASTSPSRDRAQRAWRRSRGPRCRRACVDGVTTLERGGKIQDRQREARIARRRHGRVDQQDVPAVVHESLCGHQPAGKQHLHGQRYRRGCSDSGEALQEARGRRGGASASSLKNLKRSMSWNFSRDNPGTGVAVHVVKLRPGLQRRRQPEARATASITISLPG